MASKLKSLAAQDPFESLKATERAYGVQGRARLPVFGLLAARLMSEALSLLSLFVVKAVPKSLVSFKHQLAANGACVILHKHQT